MCCEDVLCWYTVDTDGIKIHNVLRGYIMCGDIRDTYCVAIHYIMKYIMCWNACVRIYGTHSAFRYICVNI